MTNAHEQDATVAMQWSPELVRSFWEYYARNRQDDYFTHLFGDQIYAETRRFFPTDAELLDYGCGSGFLLQILLKTHRAAGCDFTPENVHVTRTKVAHFPNLIDLYTVEDVLRLERRFDVLYVVETVEHVLDLDLNRFFSTLNKLLKPGGTIIVTTPNNEDLQTGTVFCPSCRQTFHRWQHVRSFDQHGITAFMQRGGFVCREIFATDFSAKTSWQQIKRCLRGFLGRPNPHLVYVGTRAI